VGLGCAVTWCPGEVVKRRRKVYRVGTEGGGGTHKKKDVDFRGGTEKADLGRGRNSNWDSERAGKKEKRTPRPSKTDRAHRKK